MASNTQILTGFIVRPNGAPFVAGTIKFDLTGTDTDADEVIAREKSVQFPIEADGSVAVELWSNTRGSAGSFYIVQVREGDVGYFETVGRIQVPDAGPYDLATLMRADVPAAQKTFYSVLTQAEYDAFLADMDAKLSDMDTKLTVGSGYVDAALVSKNEAAAQALLAYGYSQDVASAIVYQDLASINATLAGNAVAYDINTSPRPSLAVQRRASWYNEPLGTETRGTRAEMPAAIAATAEAGKVTLWDMDGPTPEMWIVFISGTNRMLRGNINSDVKLIGNIMLVSGDVGCAAKVDFAADRSPFSILTTALTYVYLGNIAQRNDLLGYSSAVILPVPNQRGTSLDARIYPWSPIDAETGSQIPTIAVGTEGGISIIDGPAGVGTVVDITHSSTSFIRRLLLGEDGSITYATDSDQRGRYVHTDFKLPIADVTKSHGYDGTFSDAMFHTVPSVFYSGQSGYILGGSNMLLTEGAAGTQLGFTLQKLNKQDHTETLQSYITSQYNTGWFGKGCLGVLLCSTDTTSLIESGELAPNGTFDTDLSGFTQTGADANNYWEWNAGKARCVSDGGFVPLILGGFEVGKSYYMTFDTTNTVGNLKVGSDASAINIDSLIPAGSHSYHWTATTTNLYFSRQNGATDATLDNLSVRRTDADRSLNNKGLIINGTVDCVPVAAGSELVGYKGLNVSTGRYLERPYDPDMDFGTGDFTFMGWSKTQNITYNIFPQLSHLYDTGSGANGWELVPTQTDIRFRTRTDGAISDVGVGLPVATLDKWTHWAVVRRGTTIDVYLDGFLAGTRTHSNFGLDVVGNDQRTLQIASGVGDKSHALIQPYARAVSADEIKFMCEQGRPMFQLGAQVTLYGTSDNVTALITDEITGLKHPCTSQGRNDFSGLIRVGNTATGRTVIAAHDGLFLEQ